MDREYVSTLDFFSLGYDLMGQILEDGFLNGSIYQYFGVPEGLHAELMTASSHGKYMNEYIMGLVSLYCEVKVLVGI